MPKLSSIIKKPLLLLYEVKLTEELFGGLINVKTKKLEYYAFGDACNPFLIAPKKIERVGENALILINDLYIKRASDIDLSKLAVTPLGKKVYSSDGKFFGTVTDIEINDENICTDMYIGEEKIALDSVLEFGDIVLTKGGWCPKICKYVPKKVKSPKKAQTIRVKMLDGEQQAAQQSDIGDDYPQTQPITLAQAIREEARILSEERLSARLPAEEDATPSEQDKIPTEQREDPHIPRIISSYGFLLGRIVTKNIFSYNRELLINEGDVVTEPVVEKARSAGKLVELTLHSKN